jgi:hypothetical protein
MGGQLDRDERDRGWRYSFIESMDVSGAVQNRVNGDWSLPGTTGEWHKGSDFSECPRCGHPAFIGGRCARCNSRVRE